MLADSLSDVPKQGGVPNGFGNRGVRLDTSLGIKSRRSPVEKKAVKVNDETGEKIDKCVATSLRFDDVAKVCTSFVGENPEFSSQSQALEPDGYLGGVGAKEKMTEAHLADDAFDLIPGTEVRH